MNCPGWKTLKLTVASSRYTLLFHCYSFHVKLVLAAAVGVAQPAGAYVRRGAPLLAACPQLVAQQHRRHRGPQGHETPRRSEPGRQQHQEHRTPQQQQPAGGPGPVRQHHFGHTRPVPHETGWLYLCRFIEHAH